jgi:hypothetical protein
VRFRTIKLGAHQAGRAAAMRAPHLRLTIFASGIDRLVTQIFFADEPLNASDAVLNSVPDPVVRARLIAAYRDLGAEARLDAGERRRHEYAIDIVLRGELETPFFDDWGLMDTRVAGRLLSVVVNDRESETRTPSQPLYRIPVEARDPFTPCPPAPLVRPGESDLTRIAPGRPPRLRRRGVDHRPGVGRGSASGSPHAGRGVECERARALLARDSTPAATTRLSIPISTASAG